MLVRGRPGDTFPRDSRELAAMARYLGYGTGADRLARPVGPRAQCTLLTAPRPIRTPTSGFPPIREPTADTSRSGPW